MPPNIAEVVKDPMAANDDMEGTYIWQQHGWR